MFKLLAGAAMGFAAAWFMDSKEGEGRRALVKEKASGVAGKAKQQVSGGGDDPSAESYESYEQARAEDSRDEADAETVSRP